MWCKVINFVKIYMLRLKASDLGLASLIYTHIINYKALCQKLNKSPAKMPGYPELQYMETYSYILSE